MIVGGNSGDAKSVKVNCQTFKVLNALKVCCLFASSLIRNRYFLCCKKWFAIYSYL